MGILQLFVSDKPEKELYREHGRKDSRWMNILVKREEVTIDLPRRKYSIGIAKVRS